MPTAKLPLSKLNHQFGKHVIDKASGVEVFEVSSSHTLIQAAGYLKHKLAKESGEGVFFRGQTKLYDTLPPTLLRGVKDGSGAVKRRHLLEGFLQTIDNDKKALRAVAPEYREALLQHYGIRTTWIDVVDNIWIALWFACHHALEVGRDEKYLHFEKRIRTNHSSGDSDYAYVLLLASAFFSPVTGFPGHYRDARSETIDLRVAAPSQFLRPHAQHAILVRRLSKTGQPVSDCKPLHVGTIRVPLSAAIDWLGNATTLMTHSLFPPAFYDYGYRELLEHVHSSHRHLGSIHYIQA